MKSKTILLSIHPCFVEKIFTGEKLYEYRKQIPIDINHIIIYATVPVKNIVAFVEVDTVLKGSPQEIWEKTKHNSGITKDFFMSYFNHKCNAFAIKFKDVQKLSEPKSLHILENIEYAPQSFSYITESLTSIKEKFNLQHNQ